METTTEAEARVSRAAYALPVRLAWSRIAAKGRAVEVIKGSTGSHGDAGWTIVNFESIDNARDWMTYNPQARMPCWARVEVRA